MMDGGLAGGAAPFISPDPLQFGAASEAGPPPGRSAWIFFVALAAPPAA
jgi:hypothetical protein